MKSFLLILISTILILPATGQNIYNYTPVKPDQKQEKTTVQPQDSLSKPAEKRHFISQVKVNPVLVFNGDFPVYWEQKLFRGLTAEVSAGVTYKNYIAEILETDFEHFTEVERNSRPGYSFSGALRYYPFKKYGTGHGFYFSPEVRYRVYHFEVTKFDNEPYYLEQTKKLTDIKLAIGWVAYLDKHLILDLYAGAGVRDKDFKNHLDSEDTFQQSPNWPYHTEIVATPVVTHQKTIVPILAGGFKLGFSF